MAAVATQRTSSPSSKTPTKVAAPAVKPRGAARPPALSEATKRKSRELLDLPEPKNLRKSDVPGLWINGDGQMVDERGIAVSWRQVKEAEAEQDSEVLGHEVTTPAELMKRIALDPRQPLYLRLDAAKAAAPYYDRKMPTALEGGDADKPLRAEHSVLIRNLNSLSAAERKAALALLEKLGVLGD